MQRVFYIHSQNTQAQDLGVDMPFFTIIPNYKGMFAFYPLDFVSIGFGVLDGQRGIFPPGDTDMVAFG